MESEKQIWSQLRITWTISRWRSESCFRIANIGWNIAAGKGKGYSKKESQQEAAHETLNKIKNDPQFIDIIFAAKAEREKAENPTNTEEEKHPAPIDELKESFIQEETISEKYEDHERIIAEAEAAAFLEKETTGTDN